MKKLSGYLLLIIGIILILISIVALVRAFDVFTSLDSTAESIGYTLGSIIFPLLLTVLGRWVFRKGKGLIKEKPPTP
ncbi:hypothetical protein [Aurantibacillus circumpalustris]|uniref:hypothetical protein n=1 Tax=Aurantibacillus circumpalustris TaxID=3036359 RepID=UPI00295B889F|nr:hypothetical protein [Aurantibacillus circumpalustris]